MHEALIPWLLITNGGENIYWLHPRLRRSTPWGRRLYCLFPSQSQEHLMQCLVIVYVMFLSIESD